MGTGAITGYIDVAQLVLYVFWFFFFGLVFWLHREGKREGYPLESDRSKYITVVGFPKPPPAKTYLMPHGGGTREAPHAEAEYKLAAEPLAAWPGAPLQPTGNPMTDGVGPAAFAIRPEVPDMTHDGRARIVPMRIATEFSVEPRDPDPRGKQVYGLDGEVGATVTDIWVDRAEPQIRYLEIETEGRRTLLPINYVRISRDGEQVNVASIKGEHFRYVPGLASLDQVTLQEEDKICAYYGGGHLYATAERSEPLI